MKTRHLLALALAVPAIVHAAGLPPDVRRALDDVLACERPGGGWTYVCAPATGPHGAVTWPLVRARRLLEPLGLADWDVAVLRSPGTPAAGLVLAEAWRQSRDDRYLAAARRAGDLLLATQLGSGGWHSEAPMHGTRPARWFGVVTHWATLDDDVTSGAIRLLLALHEITADPRYRRAAERGLALLEAAQLPSGAWPLTWRRAWIRWLNPSFEDLPSTNDAATAGPIHAMLAGARVLGRPDLAAAARRGGRWLVRAQGRGPHAGWAQQYDAEGRPGPGRSFEPPGLASWESRLMIEALLALASETGDARFCAGAARGLAWLVRSAIAPGCWARLYDPRSNRPIYIGPDGTPVPTPDQGRRPYRWIGDYGIPGLLASLGLDADGGPRRSTDAPPPRRIPGDAGACPQAPRARPRGPHSRGRILRSASALMAVTRASRPPCGDSIRRVLTDD